MKETELQGNHAIRPDRAIFNAYTLVGLVYSLSFTLVFYWMSPDIFLACIHFSAFVIFLFNYIVLLGTGNFRRAVTTFLVTALAVVISLFATGGWENTGYLWPLVYLIFVFFISGKYTWRWAFYLFAGCLSVVFLKALRIIHQPYSYIALFNFFMGLAVMSIFIYYFQKATIRYETRLRELSESLEREVQKKTAELTQVLERVTVPFIAVDKDWKCTYVNRRGAMILNRTPEQLTGKDIWEEFPQGGSPLYETYHRAFGEQRYVHSVDYSAYSGRWFESDVYPSPEGLSIFFNEITEKKKTEQALKNSLEKTKLIIDSALDAIICIDGSSVITEWNPQAEQLFGWKRDEVSGRLITDTIIPEEYRGLHQRGMARYLATGEGPALNKFLELTALRRNGTLLPIELTIIPIVQDEERFFCAFIRDISYRKRTEMELRDLNTTLKEKAEALAASNAELEQFAFIASHDLQEPLRTITGFINLLKERYRGKLDDKADRYLQFISESSDRMKILIKELLDYSRIGKSREMEQVDCNLILRHVLTDLGKILEEQGANIDKSELPVISGYRTELKLLFQNLVSNSLKFRKNGTPPEMSIAAQKKDGCWEFSFRDNGIGIEEKNYQQIFVIFKRLHPRSSYEGSGIGLAHCKKIVELHGGRIWVESVLGEGSIFYFTIPEKG